MRTGFQWIILLGSTVLAAGLLAQAQEAKPSLSAAAVDGAKAQPKAVATERTHLRSLRRLFCYLPLRPLPVTFLHGRHPELIRS